MINFGFIFKGSTCIAIINSKWYGNVHCHQLFVRTMDGQPQHNVKVEGLYLTQERMTCLLYRVSNIMIIIIDVIVLEIFVCFV